MDFNAFLSRLAEMAGTQLTSLVALAVIQVILAVSVSIKNKIFEWRKLGDFFSTIILPKLGGWLATVIMGKFVLIDLPLNLGPSLADGAFAVLVMSFAGSILSNLRDLEILPSNVTKFLDKSGVPEKTEEKLP